MEETYVYQVKPMKPEDIEGLAEIRASVTAWINYHQAKMEFERGDRDFEDIPPYDPGETDRLRAKYPRAAAYLEAERWAKSCTPIKARLGAQARERILNGEDYNIVLADMTKGLEAFNLAQMGN